MTARLGEIKVPVLVLVGADDVAMPPSMAKILAEGLPEGVKFEITQPVKPDPNTITVTLTTEKSVTAPFRLLGKVKDEPKFTRVAFAPLPDGPCRCHHLRF